MGEVGSRLSILESGSVGGTASGAGARTPWIGVRFRCAGAYVRVPRNRDGTAYLAMCPRCGKTVRFRVGAGGTEQRFFEIAC